MTTGDTARLTATPQNKDDDWFVDISVPARQTADSPVKATSHAA